jgi:phosphoribosylformylglycinamidine synthase subunit PurL
MTAHEFQQKLKTYRLSEDEYDLMKSLLGREPKPVEWPLFSALWSEHCSYKSSKIHLRKFSYRNASTPDMDGENAGVVDLGFGEQIAFKMESHNHPSFIEPVQGSATGVGGILRDIFTMGARPIMSANYLCFGTVDAPRMKYLMNGVVDGISGYGNCVGVPTMTGQTNFHPRYNKNILVNALNVGYFGPGQKMALSKAQGEGNLVVYVGAKTGRDGVHGASMASEAFDADSESKRPNVQIGDPFYEKLLIEACLDVLAADLVVAMQDMGAAGLTSSSFEMASKGQVGLLIDLKKVPLRDSTMSAEDILLSESQERMLLICKPENLNKLQDAFKKWSLDAVVLGQVLKDKNVKLMWGSEILTEIDPDLIVEKAPRYERPYEAWKFPNQVDKVEDSKLTSDQIKTLLENAMNDFKLNARKWVYDQYDQRVGARTAMACESSVAFARLDHSERGLGLVVGCRPEIMMMDARIGALDAVYYPALQLAIKGAKALAVTDCLNFGNPQKKEIMSEFVASVEAIAEAAQALDAPVISGNVSFYNETIGENIVSTPATGVVGIRDSVEDLIGDFFKDSNESIFQVKLKWVEANVWLSDRANKAPQFSLNRAQDVPAFIKRTTALDSEIRTQKIRVSAIKSVGLGGVAVTCFKMTTDETGFDLSYELGVQNESTLFKDQFYSFLIVTSEEAARFKNFLQDFYFGYSSVSIEKVGETRPEYFKISHSTNLSLKEFRSKYKSGLEVIK